MKTLEDFLQEQESFTYEELEGKFEEYLDEVYEPVELAGMTIYASSMKEQDPVMFRCGLADWSSEEYEEFNGVYYTKEDFTQAEADFEEYEEDQEEE